MPNTQVPWYKRQETITGILNLVVAGVFQVIAMVQEGGATVDYVAVALVATTTIQKVLKSVLGTETVTKE